MSHNNDGAFIATLPSFYSMSYSPLFSLAVNVANEGTSDFIFCRIFAAVTELGVIVFEQQFAV